MQRYLICLILLIVSTTAAAEEKIVFNDIKIANSIKWIDETPLQPEDYIGQVWLVDKKEDTIPYFASIDVPIKKTDEPTVKKSILIKSSTDGSVSLLNLITLRTNEESVYQFQIVDNKKWAANQKDQNYIKQIAKFRNDPVSSGIFDDSEYKAIVMCTAVVQKKIWYKKFKKKGDGGSGAYIVKIDGNDYYSSEDYEEIVKYGMLIRPINGFGVKLPKTIINANQVETAISNAKIPQKTINNIQLQKRNERTQKEAECSDNPDKCLELDTRR